MYYSRDTGPLQGKGITCQYLIEGVLSNFRDPASWEEFRRGTVKKKTEERFSNGCTKPHITHKSHRKEG